MYADIYQNYHMVIEYAEDGCLSEYLKRRFEDLTWEKRYKLGVDITNGLKYLHVLKIVHKDLVWLFKYTYMIFNYYYAYIIVLILFVHSLLQTFLFREILQR